jgi:four helix bundle protein
MLRIYSVMLEALVQMRPVMEQIKRRDANLEDQMRRAATSVVLNIAEGSGSRGKNRGARYATALGSARETVACLEIAHALGYVASVDTHLEAVRPRLREVIGTLVKVAVA